MIPPLQGVGDQQLTLFLWDGVWCEAELRGSGGWGALVAGSPTSAAGFPVSQGLFSQLRQFWGTLSRSITPSLVSGKITLPGFLYGLVLPCLSLPAFPLPWYQEIP